jgi:tRNA threonylcarbamoyladenosine biosynthesis protein TsaB
MLLALELSHRDASVALWDGGVVAAQTFIQGLRQGGGVLPVIAELCQPDDLKTVALSIGPGSFTGLRSALAAAKMLALTLNVDVVPVPTLHVIAAQAATDHVAVALDARKHRVIAATFGRTGDGWLGEEPRMVDAAEWVAALPADASVMGEGVAAYRDLIPPMTAIEPESAWTPKAATLAALAASGDFPPVDPMHLVPAYTRLSEPEEKRLARPTA